MGIIILLFFAFTLATDGEWRPVWEDDFTGHSLDLTKWDYDYGENWFHGELQAYTNNSRNVFLKDSNLYLRAYKEKYKSKDYTSGRIFTRYTASWYCGRFEAKMKMPTGMGMWPAFWLLPVWLDWPLYGEIDIMEHIGKEPYTQHAAVHYGHDYFNLKSKPGKHESKTFLNESFSLYAIEWEPEELRFYINDTQYLTFNKKDRAADEFWPFDQKIPFYIILNLAIGGSWPGPPDETTKFPQDFIIDYVKVYQK